MEAVDEFSTRIEAAPDVVWELISDVEGMRKWSPHLRRCFWVGRLRGPVEGARFLGLNGSGALVLPTLNKVERVERGREFVVRTTTHNTVWRYVVEPDANGTVLTEQRDLSRARHWLLRAVYPLFGGYDNFHGALREGMRTTLQRIKEAAEAR